MNNICLSINAYCLNTEMGHILKSVGLPFVTSSVYYLYGNSRCSQELWGLVWEPQDNLCCLQMIFSRFILSCSGVVCSWEWSEWWRPASQNLRDGSQPEGGIPCRLVESPFIKWRSHSISGYCSQCQTIGMWALDWRISSIWWGRCNGLL